MTTTLDTKTHKYSDERGPLSGVTSLLSDAGLIDYSFIPKHMREHYMDRGKKVHDATHMLDEDDLIYDSLDPKIKPYVDNYIKFKEFMGPRYKILKIETILTHPLQRYAGKRDRLCVIDDELSTLDIKTGALQPEVALQLEGYKQAHNFNNPEKATGKYALSLLKGAYKLKKYSDPGDAAAWLAVVTLARWKERNFK